MYLFLGLKPALAFVKKMPFVIFCIYLSSSWLEAQQITSTVQLLDDGLISARPNETFLSPEMLVDWKGPAFPTNCYQDGLIELQKKINQKSTESLVTYSPEESLPLYEGPDAEEITPYTWKWVHLKTLDSTQNQQAELILRRPNEWLKRNGLDQVGNKIFLNIEEFGIGGWVEVAKVRPNTLDTRIGTPQTNGDFITRPIIGKYIHQSNKVYILYFTNGDTLGVTANHPIYSSDRKSWIPASQLKIGEQMLSQTGPIVLTKRKKFPGTHTVYNIEVYRSHNYLVSPSSILVHNGPCFIDFLKGSWDHLARVSGRERMGNFMVDAAGLKVGKSYDILFENVLRVGPKSKGDFSEMVGMLLKEAHESGAEEVLILVKRARHKVTDGYFNNISDKWEGLSSIQKGEDILIGGKLKDIKKIQQE